MNQDISRENLRIKIIQNKEIPLDKKRSFLDQLAKMDASQRQEVSLFLDQYVPPNGFFAWIKRRGHNWKVWGVVCGIIAVFYWFYHPSGIRVYGLPNNVLAVRSALSAMKKDMPDYYVFTKENTDVIVYNYFRFVLGAGGYVSHENRGSEKNIIYIQTIKNDPAWIGRIIVHEACHNRQQKDGRLWTEPRQKVEHECGRIDLEYLLTYQRHHPEENIDRQVFFALKTLNKSGGTYGPDWKKTWNKGDTTKGLLERFLSYDVIKEEQMYGAMYEY